MNSIVKIPTMTPEAMSRRQQVREALERYVTPERLDQFSLPEADAGKTRRLVVPISGGSDSSCMAVVMSTLFPHEEITYVFCDTGAESADLHHNLATLESFLDIRIHRVIPARDLFQLIDDYNGFLPGPKSRWCTKKLKLEALDNWLAKQFDLTTDQVFTFVGLRADEDRFGYVSDDPTIRMKLPYHDLGMGRTQVYGLLADTVGIARNYQYNSRSSCTCCFFKRRSEKIGMLINRPEEFHQAAALEKLTPEDEARFDNLHQAFLGEKGMSLRHVDYMIPEAVDIRTAHFPHPPKPIRHGDKETLDLFDVTDSASVKDEYDELFCAVAFLVHPLMNLFGGPQQGHHGAYKQDFVSYSPTLAGLGRALTFYWEHRLNTPEVWGLTQQQLREQLKIAVYQVKVPKGIIDLGSVSDASYTWATGEAYMQIERHVRLIHQALRLESLRQQKAQYLKLAHIPEFEFTWEFEQLEAIERDLELFKDSDLGCYIAWSGVYTPPADEDLPSEIQKLRMEAKIDREVRVESTIACVACSL